MKRFAYVVPYVLRIVVCGSPAVGVDIGVKLSHLIMIIMILSHTLSLSSQIWPLLASRVPAFESCKVKNAWAGFYDYNYFDENCVIGNHPYYQDVYFCTGFSGHGIQQAPAAGLCLAELIIHQQYDTIDLSRFDFRRFLVGAPMHEPNIV